MSQERDDKDSPLGARIFSNKRKRRSRPLPPSSSMPKEPTSPHAMPTRRISKEAPAAILRSGKASGRRHLKDKHQVETIDAAPDKKVMSQAEFSASLDEALEAFINTTNDFAPKARNIPKKMPGRSREKRSAGLFGRSRGSWNNPAPNKITDTAPTREAGSSKPAPNQELDLGTLENFPIPPLEDPEPTGLSEDINFDSLNSTDNFLDPGEELDLGAGLDEGEFGEDLSGNFGEEDFGNIDLGPEPDFGDYGDLDGAEESFGEEDLDEAALSNDGSFQETNFSLDFSAENDSLANSALLHDEFPSEDEDPMDLDDDLDLGDEFGYGEDELDLDAGLDLEGPMEYGELDLGEDLDPVVETLDAKPIQREPTLDEDPYGLSLDLGSFGDNIPAQDDEDFLADLDDLDLGEEDLDVDLPFMDSFASHEEPTPLADESHTAEQVALDPNYGRDVVGAEYGDPADDDLLRPSFDEDFDLGGDGSDLNLDLIQEAEETAQLYHSIEEQEESQDHPYQETYEDSYDDSYEEEFEDGDLPPLGVEDLQYAMEELHSRIKSLEQNPTDTKTSTNTILPLDWGLGAPTMEGASEQGGRISFLLHLMHRRGAKDLHVHTGAPPMMRQEGSLQALRLPSMDLEAWNEAMEAFCPPSRWAAWRQNLDLDFLWDHSIFGRLRITLFQQHEGPSAIFQLVSDEIKTLEELTLPQQVEQILESNSGLNLILGPSGSGISTTATALLEKINRTRTLHVISLEEPIEHIIPTGQSLIHQREIGVHASTQEEALLAVLQEKPDILLVHDIVSPEALSSVLEASEMGILVIAVLQVPSMEEAFTRLTGFGLEGESGALGGRLANNLRNVMIQRLLPTLAGGRAPATGFIEVNTALSILLRLEDVSGLRTVLKTRSARDEHSLESYLLQMLKEGLVGVEAAKAACLYPEVLDEMLSGPALPQEPDVLDENEVL